MLFYVELRLINSPPMCHLHAGGNLYREISDDDCQTLMRQCIDIAKLYPESIDVRPTVIAVPKQDKGSATELLPRLERLTAYYQHLVTQDPSNEILGKPSEYYQVYDQAKLHALSQLETSPTPQTTDQWLIPVSKLVSMDKLQSPLIAVQEYGWNIFRLSASAWLQLAKLPNAHMHLSSQVIGLTRCDNAWKKGCQNGWQVNFIKATANDDAFGGVQTLQADFVVNACGFRTGIIDDQAEVKVRRMVEFKASYVSEWHQHSGLLPEIIFHGERGTPQGMAQFTPYADGFFQLHGMTESITLFADGLSHSTADSSQPPINQHYLDYIEAGWDTTHLRQRTQNAIDHVSRFIPSFATAKTVDSALYGAQQIPSDDITLRVAGLRIFEGMNYAIAENVKANSALDVANGVVKALVKAGLLTANQDNKDQDQDNQAKQNHPDSETLQSLPSYPWHRLCVDEVDALARQIAIERGYPAAMAKVNRRLLLS